MLLLRCPFRDAGRYIIDMAGVRQKRRSQKQIVADLSTLLITAAKKKSKCETMQGETL